MTRDIEWLKEEIGELPCVDAVFNSDGFSYIDSGVPVMSVYDLVDKMNAAEAEAEPETVASVMADFFKITNRLIEVLNMNVAEAKVKHPILQVFDEKVKDYESYGSTSMRMAEVRKVLVEALEEEEE